MLNYLKNRIFFVKNGWERAVFLFKTNTFREEMNVHLRHLFKKRQKKILPLLDLLDIIQKDVDVEIIPSENATISGNVKPEELEIISKLVKYSQPNTIFEIGTFDGRTSLHLAINSSEKATVYTLDLPKSKMNQTKLRIKRGDITFINKEESGRELKRTDKTIFQLYGDSATFDYSDYINQMDFVFIDGSHSYEYVISDTNVALKLLKDGKGIIVWHDYGWREVVKALNEFYLSGGEFRDLKHIRNTSFVVLEKK